MDVVTRGQGSPGMGPVESAPSGPLRYQEDPPHVAVAYAGFVVAIILGVAAEAAGGGPGHH
jgi:hypothetical protein